MYGLFGISEENVATEHAIDPKCSPATLTASKPDLSSSWALLPTDQTGKQTNESNGPSLLGLNEADEGPQDGESLVTQPQLVMATPSPRDNMPVLAAQPTNIDETDPVVDGECSQAMALAAALRENQELKARLAAMHNLITGGLNHVLEEADKISPAPDSTGTALDNDNMQTVHKQSAGISSNLAIRSMPAFGLGAGISALYGASVNCFRWPRTRFARITAGTALFTLAAAGIYGGLRHTGKINKIDLSKICNLVPRGHNPSSLATSSCNAATSVYTAANSVGSSLQNTLNTFPTQMQ